MPSSVEVTSIVIDERDCSDAIREASASRAAARLELEAMDKTRRLTRELAAAEVSVRDIGQALGVSCQRAHQLIAEDDRADSIGR